MKKLSQTQLEAINGGCRKVVVNPRVRRAIKKARRNR